MGTKRTSAVPATTNIRIGIGGWVYAPWRGVFYPGDLVQRRELEYASRHVTSIEVNGTYYRAQTEATYAKWAAEVPDGFVFSLKAPRRITASRSVEKVGPQVVDFLGGVLSLGDRLGPVVWRFEAGTRVDRDGLDVFIGTLPATLDGRALRHVLDLREPALATADVIALARRHGVGTVFTDSPEHRSLADITTDFIYARLMRSRATVATGYPGRELDAWAARLRTWADGGEPDDLPRIDPTHVAPQQPRDVFVYFIASDKQRNPASAMGLIKRVHR